MEIKLSSKGMKVMVKKVMFLVIGCMALWWILMPSLLEEALYSAIKLQCKKKDNCIVHLHEITPFKWDKAYFFERTSPYYVDIDNIIGVQHKVIQDVLTTLVVFIRQGKIVQEDTFELIYSDYYDISFPPFF